MKNRETYNLEFKSKLTDTFLKSVSAFANYNDGEIVFGVNDDGRPLGILELKQEALRIENKINDNISPRPDFRIDVDEDKQIIVLRVSEGDYKPYLYKNKAYMRRDAASCPVDDREEMKRLILEGLKLDFEDLESRDQELTFSVLESALAEHLKIDRLSRDILKTLGFYTEGKGYNIAASLVADKNTFRLIDMVKFGRNINEMTERVQVSHVSILSAYRQAIEMYRRYYQYELIDGAVRKKAERIPEDAFREAIANALVHRDWRIPAAVKIEMHEQYIEIASPGGLPIGISEEAYLNGQVSILRNEKIRSLFNRLGLIERFGTGIKRIRFLYSDSVNKAEFKIYANSISVRLPVIMREIRGLSEDASGMFSMLPDAQELSRIDIEKLTGFEKSKTLRLLDELLDGKLVRKTGRGRGTKYVKQV